MKKILMTIALLCAMVQGAWAQASWDEVYAMTNTTSANWTALPEGTTAGAPAIGNYGINSCGTITIENTVTRVTATKGSGASNSIGFAEALGGSCGQVTIGGTVYWDGSAYQNDGEAFLATSPLTYQP